MKDARAHLAQAARATARDRTLIAARRGGPMDTGDQLRALLDSASLLDGEGIAHALIGGLAVGIHSGTPRATIDIDIAVTSEQDATSLVASFEGRGYSLRGRFEHSLNLRHPTGEPVQLSFDPAFDPMIERAETIQVGDAVIRVVTKADLIVMKERAAADPTRRRSKALRDQADIALLKGDVPSPDEGW